MRLLKCSFSLIVFLLIAAPSAFANPEQDKRLCEFMLVGKVDAASLLPSFGTALHELFPYDLLQRDYSSFPLVIGQRMDAATLRAMTPTEAERRRVSEAAARAFKVQNPGGYVDMAAAKAAIEDQIGNFEMGLSDFERLRQSEEMFHRESASNSRFVYEWKDVRFAVEGLRMKGVTVRESPITLLPREMQIEILDRVLARLRAKAPSDRRSQLMVKRIEFLRKKAEHTPFSMTETEVALKFRDPTPLETAMLTRAMTGSVAPNELELGLQAEIEGGLQPENPAARAMFEEFVEEVVIPHGPLSHAEYFALLNAMIEIRGDYPARASSGTAH